MAIQIPSTFDILSIPVPEDLDRLVGYQADRRYLAIYWEPGGDEVSFSDGVIGLCGGNWRAWLAYNQHPIISAVLLRQYDFGSSEEEAKHWFVLDRQEWKAYAGPAREVEIFLARATEEERSAMHELTEEEILEMVKRANAAMANVRPPSSVDIMAKLQSERKKIKDMTAWLDTQAAERARTRREGSNLH